LAACYNRQVIKKLPSSPGVKTNIPDEIVKWTPLKYAYRMKSWMAMDVLLQNGANPENIVPIRPHGEAQECDKEALFECASNGYTKLLELMLNCGNEVNALSESHENFNTKDTLLHIASRYCQVEVTRLLVERGADINIRNARTATALHYAARSDSVEIINILLDKGMSVDLADEDDRTPLHYAARYGNVEATKALVERGASLIAMTKKGDTALFLAGRFVKLEVSDYLMEKGAYININRRSISDSFESE
jgi:ankyrin repeat protein